MYTVQQIQAADYLLKRLRYQLGNDSEILSKNFQFVINAYNNLWSGDFVYIERTDIVYESLQADGYVDKSYLYSNDQNWHLIRKSMDSLNKFLPKGSFYRNPFQSIKSPDQLHKIIFEIVENAEIVSSDSPLPPYLFNPVPLNSAVAMPFIFLGNEKYQVVSIVENPLN
jgi:hypothetical protein